MSAEDDKWSTERAEPPARRGVPRWVWGCGIGCGLFGVLGLLLVLFAVRWTMNMADPERQWENLGEVVAVVERPAGWQIHGLPVKLLPGFHGAWILDSADRSRHAEIWAFDADGKDAFAAMFTGDQSASVSWTGIGFYDREPGTLAVQGREMRTLRFRTQRPDEVGETGEAGDEGGAGEVAGAPEAPDAPDAADEPGWVERAIGEYESQLAKAAVNVEVTSDPTGEPLVLIQYSTPGKLERIADEELLEFLAHFDFGAR